MPIEDPDAIVEHLKRMQRRVRRAVGRAHSAGGGHAVRRASSADTIYEIDALIEPVLEEYLDQWSRSLPMVVIAEGLEPETGRVFPAGLKEEAAAVRIILDPIDGTRGLMYDKRAAWSLAGVAPNKGSATRLSDIEIAVMMELPTRKMGWGDLLWAVKGRGAHGVREKLNGPADEGDAPPGESLPLELNPSGASTIHHGFAAISNFFPGCKVLASELMEYLAAHLIGPADVRRATVFEDQYICTGGQFYELMMGHDRFNADLRPLFYQIQHQPEGLCCHPYDCATALIAAEAGVILTDGMGGALDGPLDVTTGLSWAGYANSALREAIEPLVRRFLSQRGARG